MAGGAGAAVGLQHVAVDGDGALAEHLQVEDARSERPIRRWISCVRPVLLCRPAASRLAAGVVARGSMPYSAVTQPSPLPFLCSGTRFSTEGGAQHAGVAELDEHRAFGVPGVAAGDADGRSGPGRAVGRWRCRGPDMAAVVEPACCGLDDAGNERGSPENRQDGWQLPFARCGGSPVDPGGSRLISPSSEQVGGFGRGRGRPGWSTEHVVAERGPMPASVTRRRSRRPPIRRR